MTRHSIAVVAFDRISPFHLAVPCIVFGEERSGIGVPSFDFRVCAAEPDALATSAGFTIAARHSLDALAGADVIIVPSWRDPDEMPPEALLDALRAAHARGAQVVGLCLGSYVLAAAGLLDGRAATTHWAWADDFARRYPRVRLDPNVLYIDDENITTSAGTAAGLDCCLHVLQAGRLARGESGRAAARRAAASAGIAGAVHRRAGSRAPERRKARRSARLAARQSPNRTFTRCARRAHGDEPPQLYAALSRNDGRDGEHVARRATRRARPALARRHGSSDRSHRGTERLSHRRDAAPAIRADAEDVAVGLSTGVSRRVTVI